MRDSLNALGKNRVFRINGCTYSTWSAGRGAVVLLFHGWPVTSFHWRRLVPRLNKAGMSTLCIDMRGLGQSLCRYDGRFNKKVLAEDLLALLEVVHPGLPSYSIVGHDWGASIGVALASIDRRRVERLVVEEEVVPGISVKIPEPGASRYPTWHGALHRVPGLAEQLVVGRESIYVEYFLRLRKNPQSLSAKDLRTYLRAYRGVNQVRNGFAYYRSVNEDSKFFRSLRKRPLSIPVLALGGRYAMGSAVEAGLESICSDLAAHVFKSSGHYPAEEEPRAFAGRVAPFLSAVSASAVRPHGARRVPSGGAASETFSRR